MKKTILFLALVFLGSIYGLGRFLSPDDLTGCQAPVKEQSSSCRTADVIIAVSGGDTAARAKEAARLYNDGWADTIIFSGAALDKSGPSNAEVMADIAIGEGASQYAIIIEDKSESTMQNAVNVAAILEEQKVSSALLVTSAYHARRTLLEFSRASSGVDMRVHPAAGDSGWSGMWWLTPSGWYVSLSELVKIGVFSTGSANR